MTTGPIMQGNQQEGEKVTAEVKRLECFKKAAIARQARGNIEQVISSNRGKINR